MTTEENMCFKNVPGCVNRDKTTTFISVRDEKLRGKTNANMQRTLRRRLHDTDMRINGTETREMSHGFQSRTAIVYNTPQNERNRYDNA